MEPAPEPELVLPGHLREGIPLRRRTGTAHPGRRVPAQAQRREEAPRRPPPVVPLKDFEDWLEFAESVLGRQDIPEDSLASHFTTLSDLSGYEDQLEIYMGMDPFYRLSERFPWLDTVVDIAAQQGFFHWELRFAQVFADGGFDLQLGNPPWVRPDWDEAVVLAELDPWFKLTSESSVEKWRSRKKRILSAEPALRFFLDEMTANAGLSTFLADTATYPLVSGTRPDLTAGSCVRHGHTQDHVARSVSCILTHIWRESGKRSCVPRRITGSGCMAASSTAQIGRFLDPWVSRLSSVCISTDRLGTCASCGPVCCMGRRSLLSPWSTTVQETCHVSSTSDTGIFARTGSGSSRWTRNGSRSGGTCLIDRMSRWTRRRLCILSLRPN